jgi:hypothetical protein
MEAKSTQKVRDKTPHNTTQDNTRENNARQEEQNKKTRKQGVVNKERINCVVSISPLLLSSLHFSVLFPLTTLFSVYLRPVYDIVSLADFNSFFGIKLCHFRLFLFLFITY